MGIVQPGPLLQGYEVMVEAVVLGGKWPLGGDKKKEYKLPQEISVLLFTPVICLQFTSMSK